MIIELRDVLTTAKISTKGAELLSFKRDDGFEILWQGDSKSWAGQAPVLFPMVGGLRAGKAKIGGKWFEMGRHGFARKMEFTVVSQSDNSVELNLVSSDETRVFYPYDFSLTVIYSIFEKSIKTEFIVDNISKDVIAFCIGGHPGYNIPLEDGECYEDYMIEFPKCENQKCPEINLDDCLINFNSCVLELKNENTIALNHNLFTRDALVFDNLNSQKVAIKSTKSGRGLEMDFAGFKMLGIWSSIVSSPFVALEPWTGCATTTEEDDCFENKKYMTFLPSGEKKRFEFTTKYF